MAHIINRLFILLLILVACGSSGSSPTETDPGDGNETNPYEFPNATNLDQPSQ